MKQLSNLEQFISKDRASTFLKFSKGCDIKALNLYFWNVKISCELLKVISGFEVYIRNAILNGIDNSLQDGLFNITFLGALKKKHLSSIFKKVKEIDKNIKFNPKNNIDKSNPIPNLNLAYKSKVVADMKFSFWEDVLNNKVLQSSLNLRIAFPHIPQGKTTSDIQKCIKKIRMIRNRICHNEHLLKKDIMGTLEEIFEVIGYISPDLVEFERNKEQVTNLLRLKPI
ncbi:Abi family protein [Pasteurella multocida]|uniref:Abi family protein n=1 Tax=Pasteurella multocida TaxID=747 RepID=UPI00064C88A5|nr:Abi family protein [Pasteurella multocida]KLT54231.1 hypothetical protein PMTHA_08165 [Pasteurella multocida subsp. multocida]